MQPNPVKSTPPFCKTSITLENSIALYIARNADTLTTLKKRFATQGICSPSISTGFDYM